MIIYKSYLSTTQEKIGIWSVYLKKPKQRHVCINNNINANWKRNNNTDIKQKKNMAKANSTIGIEWKYYGISKKKKET